MIDPNNVPDVAENEILARYLLQRSHFRPGERTIKPDAFIPYPHHDVSVTRHLLATNAELWSVGQNVAVQTGKTLYGRADITAQAALNQKLIVKAASLHDNPNHADISGWPADKPAQKIIALELAEAATYVEKP